MTLQAIKYENGTLEVLDQLLLPKESKYIPILGVEDGWKVINKMQVCGVQLYLSTHRAHQPLSTLVATDVSELYPLLPCNRMETCADDHVGKRHVNMPTSFIQILNFYT